MFNNFIKKSRLYKKLEEENFSLIKNNELLSTDLHLTRIRLNDKQVIERAIIDSRKDYIQEQIDKIDEFRYNLENYIRSPKLRDWFVCELNELDFCKYERKNLGEVKGLGSTESYLTDVQEVVHLIEFTKSLDEHMKKMSYTIRKG